MALLKKTPNELIDLLSPLYRADVEVPTVMLWGSPGIGKSDTIRGIAQNLESTTGKKTIVHDIRLLLFNPVDLRGIPVPDKEHEFSKWLKPQIFNMDPSSNVINLLFLDEITAAAPTVQASAYQLTLDRRIGEHALPDNCVILCAGNKMTDKGVSFKMPTPLANRMTHFEVHVEVDDWKTWAINNNIHPLVTGFISYKEDQLFKFDPSKSDDIAFATPRSWSFVSKYLDIYQNVDTAYPMVAGTVGEGTAVEFKAFAKTYGQLPNVQDIFDGKKVTVEKNRMDIVCALSAAIVAKASKASVEQLKNVIRYTTDKDVGLPREFGVMTMKDMLRIQKVREALAELPEWVKWSTANKDVIH